MLQIMGGRIKSMDLNSQDDTLILTSENNQLLKCKVSLDRVNDGTVYEYLIYPFHSKSIQGIDTCIKKQLVATCSSDKTVRIWNYFEKRLEICEIFQD